MPRTILISFADGSFRYNQKLLSTSAQKTDRFDVISNFGPGDLDRSFRNRNNSILRQKRGFGYWIWKPYLILKTLVSAEEGDLIFYCDSGCTFIEDPLLLAELPDATGQDIICFELTHAERQYTKRDAFIITGTDLPEFTDSQQRLATQIVIKRTGYTLSFFKEYCLLSEDPRLITDQPNELGFGNYPEFVEHRHDQSIFSLLTKKHKLKAFRDPSQWGAPLIDLYPESNYPTIFNLTRHVTKPPSLPQRFKHRLEGKLKRPRQKNSWVDSGSGKFPRV